MCPKFNKRIRTFKNKIFGSLEKILNQLKNEEIILEFNNDQWVIKTLYLMDQLNFKFPFSKKYFEQDFYVSSNNFSAYKLIDSWPNWSGKWLNIFGSSDQEKHIFQKILEKKIGKI